MEPDGVVKNEFCPVLVDSVQGQPRPNPAEGLEHHWAPWPDVVVPVAAAAMDTAANLASQLQARRD